MRQSPRRRRPSLALAVALAAAPAQVATPAAAQDLAQALTPHVIDGDSLRLGGKTYRLHGIDAPDPAQVCADGWPAGSEAEAYLGELVAGRSVTCTPLGLPLEGEMEAVCRADGVDLAAAMVTGGRAFAYIPKSARYVSQEAAAAGARRGLHAHLCAPPWQWRAERGNAR